MKSFNFSLHVNATSLYSHHWNKFLPPNQNCAETLGNLKCSIDLYSTECLYIETVPTNLDIRYSMKINCSNWDEADTCYCQQLCVLFLPNLKKGINNVIIIPNQFFVAEVWFSAVEEWIHFQTESQTVDGPSFLCPDSVDSMAYLPLFPMNGDILLAMIQSGIPYYTSYLVSLILIIKRVSTFLVHIFVSELLLVLFVTAWAGDFKFFRRFKNYWT